MEWLSSIEPVRSFKLWLWIEKFSVIQLGPVEPVSKPVAQEYWWAGALWRSGKTGGARGDRRVHRVLNSGGAGAECGEQESSERDARADRDRGYGPGAGSAGFLLQLLHSASVQGESSRAVCRSVAVW